MIWLLLWGLGPLTNMVQNSWNYWRKHYDEQTYYRIDGWSIQRS